MRRILKIGRTLPSVFAATLFCTAGLHAAPVVIEPCEAPLTLHIRQLASATSDVLADSFELCGASASTDFLPLPDDDWAQQLNLFEQGLELRLSRINGGMRVALKAGQHIAQTLELQSNEPEQALRWQSLHDERSAPPSLRLRVEARPARKGLSRRFKIYAVLQPANEVAHELKRAGKLNVSGLHWLCPDKVTLNFEAVDAGSAFGLLANVCVRAMRAPADGSYLRFRRWKESPSQPPFADREEELQHALSQAQRGYNTQTPVAEALLGLAELALERQDYKLARAYVAKARAQPRLWFGVSDADIDIALARIETLAGKSKLAAQQLEKVLSALDQQDPDKVSEQRAEALFIRAQLHAADDKPLQAIKTAQTAYLIYEQLPFPADPVFKARKKSLVELIEASEKQLGN